MVRNTFSRLLSLAVLFVLPAFPAFVTFTDLASWQAATTQAGLTVNFENLAQNPGNSSSILSSIEYNDPGITFTAIGDSVQVNNPLASGQPWYQFNTGAVIHPAYNDTGMAVATAAAVTAFATDMMIYNGGAASSMTVTIKSGGTTLWTSTPALATTAGAVPRFFGIVSTEPGVTFNSITFTPAVARTLLDNVRIGSYNAPQPPPPDVPEPGTGLMALGGMALLLTGWLKRSA